MSEAPLTDQYGRRVSYMRVSVTDRCNLRCRYCVSQDMEFIPHPTILRYEEILDLMGIGASLGVDKIRFTGGEPFVRKGFMDFLESAAERFPGVELCVTTNATLIEPFIPRLAASGVRRVNISLDTLDPDKFERITGRPLFREVRANIDRAVEAGLNVKVNVVAMGGVNQDELPGFVDLARTLPIDLRFIEFMPIGDGTRWSRDSVWLAKDILAGVCELAEVEPVKGEKRNRGPARMYDLRDGKGRIGIISPYSNHFCASCNRLRLTSDGNLRTCLFSDRVYRLRPVLRHPALGLPFVDRIIRAATQEKPMGHKLLESMPSGAGCVTRACRPSAVEQRLIIIACFIAETLKILLSCLDQA
ncbi:GTP 3',8-cyclase MoaA [Salidesulfovibrio onnuriiensis]|uniref:GTP 3',8-cyclase MoaA n=1 Tax=Salidesulfovibrio onnuriiensis TaxID=2583823 RepID=UPI0032B87993